MWTSLLWALVTVTINTVCALPRTTASVISKPLLIRTFSAQNNAFSGVRLRSLSTDKDDFEADRVGRRKRNKNDLKSDAEETESRNVGQSLNIIRKDIPLFQQQQQQPLGGSTPRDAVPLGEALHMHTNDVVPEVDHFRRIDPEEQEFYDVRDPNDYLTSEEADEVDKIIAARKAVSAYEREMLANEEPEDITDVPPRFKHSFWALNFAKPSALQRRAAVWTDHLQWSRRSQLLSLIPLEQLRSHRDADAMKVSKALVVEEFTVLAADYLSPVAQLVHIQADSAADAKTYLDHDPLARSDVFAVDQSVFVASQAIESLDHDTSCSFDADFLSPYVAFVFTDDTRRAPSAAPLDDEAMFYQSKRYQEEMVDIRLQARNPPDRPGTDRKDTSLWDSLQTQFFGNADRIRHFAMTSAPDTIVDTANETTKTTIHNPCNGLLFLLNAHSQRDAMRFFAKDPLLSSFRIADKDLADLNRIVFTHPTSPGLKLLLAPINEIDVNGMHFMQPVNFASQAVLEPIMALQPTDLLHAPPHPSFANATPYADENEWVLQRLEEARVDIKYVTCCMSPSVRCCVSSAAEPDRRYSYPWISNLRNLGVQAFPDLPVPPREAFEEWSQPENPLVEDRKGASYPAAGSAAAPAAKTSRSPRTRDTAAGELPKKSHWVAPLMGRRAFATLNRYAAIALRRTLDRIDAFVPIEDGSLSVISESLLGRAAARRGKNKVSWTQQKPSKKGPPATTEDKKKMLSASADFFFEAGPTDATRDPSEEMERSNG